MNIAIYKILSHIAQRRNNIMMKQHIYWQTMFLLPEIRYSRIKVVRKFGGDFVKIRILHHGMSPTEMALCRSGPSA